MTYKYMSTRKFANSLTLEQQMALIGFIYEAIETNRFLLFWDLGKIISKKLRKRTGQENQLTSINCLAQFSERSDADLYSEND